MEIYQGIVLGILQGLTEFLPVSSSGHLVLGQFFFDVREPGIFFEISVHMGTLLAVIVVFFNDIKQMITAFFKYMALFPSIKKFQEMTRRDRDARMLLLIGIGSIPTALIGLFLKPYIDPMFGSVKFVGCMLLVTGTFLWFTRKVNKKGVDIMGVTPKHVLLIGFCQGLAVLPGISRSGATITAGLFSGLERETAARFSFLLSIPAITGAEIVSLKDFFEQNIVFDMSTFYGTLASFLIGYAALIGLMKVVRTGKLHIFAPYCWMLGLMVLGGSFLL